MWKATAGRSVSIAKSVSKDNGDDDWETDADFVNDVSERDQRWGAKTVQGSGRLDAVDIDQLRQNVKKDAELVKQKEYDESQTKPSAGYGGKFGVQKDRVDKSAVGFEYQAQLEKHASQKDYSQGFGGKYGVNTDRKDKSALGFDHVEKIEKHSSQKDYSQGFGGKYGVNTDHKDKSALGFEHVEKVEKHSSQKDYSQGFGGKYGVNTDHKDKSALGFDHVEKVEKHSSQIDYSKGFGGKYGVEKTMDKSACNFEEGTNQVVGTNYQRTRADSKTDVKDIKSKFENKPYASNEESKKRAEELRNERLNKDKKDLEMEKRFLPSTNDSNKTLDKEKPKIGKINISSAFLNQQNDKPKPEPSKLNNSRVPFNRFNLNNNTNNKVTSPQKQIQPENVLIQHEDKQPVITNNNNIVKEESPAKIEKKPIDIPTDSIYSNISKQQQQQQENYNDSYIQPTSAFNNSYNNQSTTTTNHSNGTALTTLITTTTNNYYEGEDEGTNDDEWEDNDNPPEIKPSYAAKVEHFQEDYTNINDVYENSDDPRIEHNGQSNKKTSNSKRAIAIYDYVATEPDEISFDPNDIVTDIVMLDEGWWQGTCKGRFGLFPSNYVQLLDD